MAMTNSEALRAQCKLICDTCYVDSDVIELTLMNAGVEGETIATQNDPRIIRAALTIVRGWVETSRAEGGISVSIDTDKVKRSMVYWCGVAGIDASEFVDDMKTIENGSQLW
jgi:hypothetical protein